MDCFLFPESVKYIFWCNIHFWVFSSSSVKLFGCSAAAQVKTSRETKGQFLSVNMAFSVGVMSAMYLTKGITGKSNEYFSNNEIF